MTGYIISLTDWDSLHESNRTSSSAKHLYREYKKAQLVVHSTITLLKAKGGLLALFAPTVMKMKSALKTRRANRFLNGHLQGVKADLYEIYSNKWS